MKTLIKENNKEIIIKKSKFIGIVKTFYDIESINNYLNELRSLYKDSTHICYAYIVDNYKKYDDDNEPSGTAGIPILDILTKNNINYCLAVVIRYFGGTLLGANGLVRAYQNTIIECINNNLKELEYGYLIRINESYNKIDNILYLLRNDIIIKKEFNNNVLIEAKIKKETLDNLSNISYEIINNNIII